MAWEWGRGPGNRNGLGPIVVLPGRTRQDPVSVTVAHWGSCLARPRAAWAAAPGSASPARRRRAATSTARAPPWRKPDPPTLPVDRDDGGGTGRRARGRGRARPGAAEAQVARLGRSAPPMLALGARPAERVPVTVSSTPTSVCTQHTPPTTTRNRRNASRGMIGRSRRQASSPAPPRRGPGRASGLSTAAEQARCSGRTACSSPSQYADLDLAQRNSPAVGPRGEGR